MNGSYYGYLDDSPGFTVKCQIFNGLYWSVWKSINNDVIIFSEQSSTWRVIDNESSLVSCNSFLSAFTYQNITNQYVIDYKFQLIQITQIILYHTQIVVFQYQRKLTPPHQHKQQL